MLVDSQRSGYSLASSLRQASNGQTASRQPGHSTTIYCVARTMMRCIITIVSPVPSLAVRIHRLHTWRASALTHSALEGARQAPPSMPRRNLRAPTTLSKRPGVYALERRSHAVERQIYLLTYNMKPLSVSFLDSSATSSVYSRIGYETVLNKWDHNIDFGVGRK